MKLAAKDDIVKERLLRAAEELFSKKGVENVSLRELTQRAQINLGGVSYHFGSRAGLEEAVFDAVAERVNGQRLADLDAVLQEARAKRRRPNLDRIIDSFARPYLDPTTYPQGALLAQLVLKHRLAPTAMTRRLVHKHFDPLGKRFVAAFCEALPKVDPNEFYWRYMFMSSAVILMSTDRRKLNRVASISDGVVDAANETALRKALTRFLVGGLKA